MKNSDVLDKAADVLAREGWVKGTRGIYGDGPKCVDGAISVALEGSTAHAYLVESHPAGIALKEFLGIPRPLTLCGWNDHQAVDGEEVIAALRDCAEKERLQGR